MLRPDAKIALARKLRKVMTKPEVLLWVQLRGHDDDGIFFRKQHPVGPYILDFYCVKAKLAVEVDGMIHDCDDNPQKDEIRDNWLRNQGIKVIRIPARDVLADVVEVALGVRLMARDMVSK